MTQSISIETIQFPNGNRSRVIQPALEHAAARACGSAGAAPARAGLVILNGGTAQLDGDLASPAPPGAGRWIGSPGGRRVCHRDHGRHRCGHLSPFRPGTGAWGRSAPCIGVAVGSLTAWPGNTTGEAPLEPNHSHFVLVEGEQWGDETETMYELAAHAGQHIVPQWSSSPAAAR